MDYYIIWEEAGTCGAGFRRLHKKALKEISRRIDAKAVVDRVRNLYFCFKYLLR